MNEINASDLLNQIRTMGRDLQPTQTGPTPGAPDFGRHAEIDHQCGQ